jgi:glycerophosphoryl diester phosphodiesterase
MTRHVEVIGHRGARGLFPENTIEGFRQALALGVHAFELDVGMTADGVVVVSHDPALNPAITRDAAGEWLAGRTPLIHHLTLDALRTYDVGRIKRATPYRMLHRAQKGSDGVRIPTLDEVLRLSPEAKFIIELKTHPRHPEWTVEPAAMAEAVLAVVDMAEAGDRVILESFDWRGPRHVRRIRPEIPLAWLTRLQTVRDAAVWWDGETPARYHGSVPATVVAQGGRYQAEECQRDECHAEELPGRKHAPVWAPAWDTLTKAAVAEARGLGLRIIPWTVNRRSAIRRLIAWGVDGLITDRPDVAMTEIDAIHTQAA